jgi:hypothetical protein
VVAHADLALRVAIVVHQRDVAGAHIGAGAALDAVEQVIFLCLAEVVGLGEPVG